MKILLIGGTGAIGTYLADILSKNNNNICITSRKIRNSYNNIQFLKGDGHNLEFLTKILKQEIWDVVVDFMVYSTSEFIERKKLLLDSTSHYIFLSTSRIFSESDEPITEESALLLDNINDNSFLKSDDYSLSKAKQEKELYKSGKLNWTIVRPYITYSKSRLQLGVFEKEEWLYRAIKGRSIVFSSDMGNKLTTMTYGFDVAKGICSIINNSKANGNVYNISNNLSKFSWNDILNLYCRLLEDKLNRPIKVKLVSMEVFKKIRPSEYQIEYDRMYNRVFDTSKINKIMDNTEFSDLKKGLERCILEFLENPDFFSIYWGLEAKKDKIANEKTPLCEINGFPDKLRYLYHRYLKAE